jgi:hypothetical protein
MYRILLYNQNWVRSANCAGYGLIGCIIIFSYLELRFRFLVDQTKWVAGTGYNYSASSAELDDSDDEDGAGDEPRLRSNTTIAATARQIFF